MPIEPADRANSRSNSSRLPTSALTSWLTPVRLPPGRLRLATNPDLTGSPPTVNMIGMVDVARFAACAVTVPPSVAIRAGWRLTRSVAIPGKRSN